MQNIKLSESVTSIGEYAFEGCSSLTSINIPVGVTSIGRSAFGNCNSLTSISIPDNVTSIGKYALSSCYELKSVTIGEGITEVPDYLCYKCTKLSEVKIGKNVKSLGSNSFFIGKDTWINKFYCYVSSPPELKFEVSYDHGYGGSPDFYGTFFHSYDNTWHTSQIQEETRIKTLYVPERSGQTYRESDWGKFFDDLVEID